MPPDLSPPDREPREDTMPASAAASPAADFPVGPFWVGQIVGGAYRIEGVLGSGGMGIVYDALDLALNRPVALKVPRQPEHAEALRKEAQAMAAVRHPNLVVVHAVGSHEGTCFLVMERLHGITLEQHLEDAARLGRPLPIREVLEHLLAITDALTAVHRAGLSHRDVKASNVILGGGRAVLTDFGLVLPEFDVHATAVVAGSVDTIAPETITNTVRPGGGPLVDLYALGVVATSLLTGQPPFSGERMEDVLAAHVHTVAPDVRQLRADVPDELATLIAELLAKSPDDRPESSETLLWRLTALHIASSRTPREHGLRVLIVDDEAEVVAILRRSLAWSFPGLAVETTTDPVEAMKQIEGAPPDVVVFDLHMPRMNGIELAMNVAALLPDRRPALVAMSAEATPYDIGVLAALGLTEFVPKDAGFVAKMCAIIGDLRRARRLAGPKSLRPPHDRAD